MSLKPGWIIFLAMLWVCLQLVITVGDAWTLNQDTFGATSTSTDKDGNVIGGFTGDQAPMIILMRTGVSIIRDPTGTVGALFGWSSSGAGSTDWSTLLDAIASILFFEANFWTGGWVIMSVLLTCIYGGFTLAWIWSVLRG